MSNLLNLENEIFLLPDGRQLGYAVYGDPNGRPVLFFHGIPGSRLQRNPDMTIMNDLSLCVYALDRPGTGLSTYQKNRTLLDWPDDVRAFCDGKGIERFAVVGVSGGGPYALACVYRLPQRIDHISIVSALGPLHQRELFNHLEPEMQPLFKFAKRTPLLLRMLLELVFRRFRTRMDVAFEHLVAKLPPGDRVLLNQPAIAEMFKKDVAQAFRNGSHGVVSDMKILSRHWGFSLSDIKLPVHVWHGTADTIVPIGLAQFIIKNLPNVQTHFIEGAGHFMALEKTKEIFSRLMCDVGSHKGNVKRKTKKV